MRDHARQLSYRMEDYLRAGHPLCLALWTRRSFMKCFLEPRTRRGALLKNMLESVGRGTLAVFQDRLPVISLFTGIAGLELGLSQPGPPMLSPFGYMILQAGTTVPEGCHLQIST